MPEDMNAMTIATYEGHVKEYADGTPHEVSGAFKDWIDESLEGLPQDARILEIGSGTGRDAMYIQSKGHTIECTDGTKGFVEYMQQAGLSAHELNILTDNLEGKYDLVLAVAVLLHFDRGQTAAVLEKIHDSLNEGGKFTFSLKQGNGEDWSDYKLGAPRYFCYWQKSEVEEALKTAGYSSYDVSDSGENDDAKWLRAIAYK